jgi:predicted acetyltransferase
VRLARHHRLRYNEGEAREHDGVGQVASKDTRMNVEVVPCPIEHKQVLKNLYTYYRYNRLQYAEPGCGSYINEYGVIDGDTSRTHEEATQGEDDLWERPDSVFPFLIRADGRLVGFAIVCGRTTNTGGQDMVMNDLFIANRYRRCGIGRQAVLTLFDRFRGHWKIEQVAGDADAQAFWQKVVGEYTQGDFVATGQPSPGQEFDSTSR